MNDLKRIHSKYHSGQTLANLCVSLSKSLETFHVIEQIYINDEFRIFLSILESSCESCKHRREPIRNKNQTLALSEEYSIA